MFLIRKLSKSNVARIMGWDKVPLKKCSIFDSIELIIDAYKKMNNDDE